MPFLWNLAQIGCFKQQKRMYGGALVAYLITNSLLVGAWLAIMQAYRRKKYL